MLLLAKTSEFKHKKATLGQAGCGFKKKGLNYSEFNPSELQYTQKQPGPDGINAKTKTKIASCMCGFFA
jgi:hypothetical protein